jgi:hypothetical protein
MPSTEQKRCGRDFKECRGILIPYLAFVSKIEDITERLFNWNLITASDLRVVIAYAFALFLAFSGAIRLRRHADSIIAGIKGDEGISN